MSTRGNGQARQNEKLYEQGKYHFPGDYDRRDLYLFIKSQTKAKKDSGADKKNKTKI